MDNIIDAKNLKYIYPCGRQALAEITCQIKKGDSIALIGSVGAGKTTFLSLLAGLVMPKEGSAIICGYKLENANLKNIRDNLGFIFQNSDNQLFMPTVLDDVAFGPLNQGCSPDKSKELALDALKTLDILHLSERPPYQLSGGEKKLSAIAGVLSMQPQIILLDEPCNGLDPYSRRIVINALNKLEQTKIIATHDMDLVLDTSDRVFVLNEGRLLRQASVEKIFKDQEFLHSVKLEQPLRMQGCPVCKI